jgi:hypothetical protein
MKHKFSLDYFQLKERNFVTKSWPVAFKKYEYNSVFVNRFLFLRHLVKIHTSFLAKKL